MVAAATGVVGDESRIVHATATLFDVIGGDRSPSHSRQISAPQPRHPPLALEVMLGGDFKPLATPLLPRNTSSPAPPPADDNEWDCRGFEPKPLNVRDGIQMAHDGPIVFVKQDRASPKLSWAATASQKVHDDIVLKQRRLLMAIAASATVMLLEFVGGIFAHSLALLADSAHMLADIASYCIALVALEIALPLDTETGCGPREVIHQKLSSRASYGLHRVEVLGGLGSILVIWFTAGGLLYEGVSRLYAQVFGGLAPKIDGPTFVLVAACGLVCNIMILYLFRDVGHGHGHGGGGHDHGHSHGHGGDDGNVTARAAVVHAMGDIAQSIGMLITAFLIALNGARWSLLDPLVTILCSLYMLYGTVGLLREVFLVLIEATPQSVDAHAVRDALRKRSEVQSIRCFHVWALAPGKVMLTACVQTTPECEDTDDVLRELQTVCRYKFGIHHATFQVTKDASLM